MEKKFGATLAEREGAEPLVPHAWPKPATLAPRQPERRMEAAHKIIKKKRGHGE